MSTYVPIQNITLTATTSTVSFRNIPQIYTDLVLVMTPSEQTSESNGVRIRVGNSGTINSGSIYSATYLVGSGTTASSQRESNATSIGLAWQSAPNSAGNRYIATVNIMNYSSTLLQKSFLVRAGNANNSTELVHGQWRSTNPIDCIDIFTSDAVNNQLTSGSSFTLYGISAGSTKAIGGQVYVSSGVAYHVFRQSGVFIPTENLTADVLVIAGGGGGGASSASAGGGGAGGVLAFASQSLLAGTSYSAVVGGGGRGAQYAASSTAIPSANGSNSQFGSLTASVGGGRGGFDGGAGGNGGSGGGGSTNGGAGGTGTSGQGFNGGTAQISGNFPGGGGGGAGGVGVSPASNGSNGGNGGSAVSTYTGWGSFSAMTSATGLGVSGAFAGGGGGGANAGTAGSGGGGGATAAATAGQSSAVSSNATANTGSGAGGSSNNGGYFVTQGAGGSGVIVVRYTL